LVQVRVQFVTLLATLGRWIPCNFFLRSELTLCISNWCLAMDSSVSLPNLGLSAPTGVSLLPQIDPLCMSASSVGGMSISSSSLPLNRPQTTDGNFRELVAGGEGASATLAVRRLMPAKPGTPLTKNPMSKKGISLVELGAQLVIQPERTKQKSTGNVPKRVLAPPSPVSSPMSRSPLSRSDSRGSLQGESIGPKRGSTPKLAVAPSGLPVAISEEDPGTKEDFQALAKESILWLDALPKLEKMQAMAEMQQWVKASGLNWDVWWQWCVRAQQESTSRSPKNKAAYARGAAMFSDPAKKPSRAMTAPHQPQFDPVPPAMKAYQSQMRSKPNIARAQARSVHNQNQEIAVQLEAKRPTTDQEWHQMAVEALHWLGQTPEKQRPAAMAHMRSWVIQAGIRWDGWWEYLRKIEEANQRWQRQVEVAQEANRQRAQPRDEQIPLTPWRDSPAELHQQDSSAAGFFRIPGIRALSLREVDTPASRGFLSFPRLPRFSGIPEQAVCLRGGLGRPWRKRAQRGSAAAEKGREEEEKS